MNDDPHFRSLENMYLAAPINGFYRPTIEISEATATIEIDVSPQLLHSAGAVHGSVYFKLLDDAAFFAANSLERQVFVLTASFTVYLTRPVSSGRLRSVGRVVNQTRTQFVAESVVYDAQDKEIGRGTGLFVRSEMQLTDVAGYTGPAS